MEYIFNSFYLINQDSKIFLFGGYQKWISYAYLGEIRYC